MHVERYYGDKSFPDVLAGDSFYPLGKPVPFLDVGPHRSRHAVLEACFMVPPAGVGMELTKERMRLDVSVLQAMATSSLISLSCLNTIG